MDGWAGWNGVEQSTVDYDGGRGAGQSQVIQNSLQLHEKRFLVIILAFS